MPIPEHEGPHLTWCPHYRDTLGNMITPDDPCYTTCPVCGSEYYRPYLKVHMRKKHPEAIDENH